MLMRFFIEGGWGMWPILFFGLTLVGASVRYAQKPTTRLLRFVAAMGLTVIIATLHATWTDFGAVFHTLGDPARVPENELWRVMFIGFKESTRPGAFGGLMLTLSSVLVAVGQLRRKDDA